MPERTSYSLFPPPDSVLQRHQSKRTPRARIPSSSGSTKRSVSAHSSPEDNSSLFEEQRASTECEAAPTSKSTDNLGLEAKEARRQSTLQTLSAQTPYRTKVEPQLPTIYSPPPDRVEHLAGPSAPPPARPLPSAPKPAPTVDTTVRTSGKTMTSPGKKGHQRNLTNSTVTSANKPSPITPESATSAPSLFTPITPPSAGPSPVKYPNIPRLSSSPAPSVVEQFSPPRRSQSRSTNRSQTANADSIASYAHSREDSRARLIAPSVRRAPSNATSSRTGASATTNPIPRPGLSEPGYQAGTFGECKNVSATPNRSMYPIYSPDVPVSEQNRRPSHAPQFHLPSQRIESKPYGPRSSTPSLTKEALAVHNASNGSEVSDDGAVAAGSTSQTQVETSQFPPRSHSLPRNRVNPKSTSSNVQQSAPQFPPPPKRETSVKSSKSRAVLTKPKPPPKDDPLDRSHDRGVLGAVGAKTSSDAAVARKAASVEEQRQKKLDFQVSGKGTYTANTSATTKYDKEHNAVTTTATTTIVNVPAKNGPLHASSDYAGIIEGKEFSKGQVDAHHQHSVAVALGAMAFAMGVGVELVGGAVNGITRSGKGKEKKEKKAIEAA